MKVTVRDTDRGYAALRRRLVDFGRPKVKVGILAGAGADQPKAQEPDLSLLFVAICNEFGTTDPVTGQVRVPERSFIRAWFDASETRLRDDLRAQMRSVVTGTRTREQVLERLGLKCVGEIQQRIADGIDPPNADSTVRRKGSSKPLIDQGQLRAGVSYKVDGGDE